MAYDKRNNEKLERDGVWVEYDDGAFEVLVGRAGGANIKYKQAFERLSKPIRRAIQHDMVSDERAERLLCETYANAVILGWRIRGSDGKMTDGFMHSLNGSGEPIPFSYDNVLAFLQDVRMSDYWADIRQIATTGTAYRAELKGVDVKN